MDRFSVSAAAVLLLAASFDTAFAACPTSLTPTNSIQPSVASGYRMALVATGLTSPRSIEFDSSGNLLVVESGVGISNHVLKDDGGECLTVQSSKMVVENSTLNHGIALSADGKTLYSSNSESAFAWPYDAASQSVTGDNTTLVTGMTNDDHTTRTLLMSQKTPGMLLISRGSTENIDMEAAVLSSGHSQIRGFNLSNATSTPYDFTTSGLRLGWGLRNSVGVAEHPSTGGIYSVENSVDQLTRDGVDIHEDNPGEELNFHGYLNGTVDEQQGSNYGYPSCYAAWVPADIPNNANITVGTQFALGDGNSTVNDTLCAETTAPRLTFQAHMAPLDIVFNASGTEAWITFHGSWDRTEPIGYKVSVVEFADGSPVAPPDSNTSITDVFWNADNMVCPGNCFRPVGLALDGQGRMFVSSDASGEIYVIVKDEVPSPPASPSKPAPVTPATSEPTASTTASAATSVAMAWSVWMAVGVMAVAAWVMG